MTEHAQIVSCSSETDDNYSNSVSHLIESYLLAACHVCGPVMCGLVWNEIIYNKYRSIAVRTYFIIFYFILLHMKPVNQTCNKINVHSSGVAKPSTIFGLGKGGKVTAAGWQVTLCDPTWHVISRSGVAILTANWYIRFFYFK